MLPLAGNGLTDSSAWAASRVLLTKNPEVDQHHEQQRQHRPEHAELGPALDHLRDAQFRSLGRVGGHEYRPDQRADDDRQRAPEQVEPHHHRQHEAMVVMFMLAPNQMKNSEPGWP
jgi:hypothetical protein